MIPGSDAYRASGNILHKFHRIALVGIVCNSVALVRIEKRMEKEQTSLTLSNSWCDRP